MSIQPHGSRTRYTRNGCRCGLCRAAHATYERNRLAGIRLSVPSGDTRAHLNTLLDSGWGVQELALHVGYDRSTIRNLASGRTQWTSRLIAEDILSVTVKAAAA